MWRIAVLALRGKIDSPRREAGYMRVRFALVAVGVAVASLAHGQGEKTRKIDAAHVSVGQRYVFRCAAGNTSTWEIVARTDTDVSYVIRQTVAGKERPVDSTPVRFALERKVGKDAEKPQAEETLTVSGVGFPCQVLEAETGGTTVKTWQSALFPEVVKVQMGKDVTAELVEIQAPKK
jgi:hypothetical protein